MFRNDQGVQPKQSFEDILLSDSLNEFNAPSMTPIGTEFDLDLDQLTSPNLDLGDSDWDVMAQSDNVFHPMVNAKPSHLSFLQLSPPALQFETLPDTKFAAISTDVNVAAAAHMPARSPTFFQSGFHQQQISAVPLQTTLYRGDSQSGVVQAKLVSNDFIPSKPPTHYDVAAAATSATLPAAAPAVAQNDKEQQDHIVNSLSVSQMLAVASAYDQVCQVEDLDIGCANWLASTPNASEVEIRAVRALFNPDRWSFAKDIVIRIVKIVEDLRSAVSEVPGPSSKAANHLIGRAKKRTSPKLLFNPMKFAMDIPQIMDENSKKRRI